MKASLGLFTSLLAGTSTILSVSAQVATPFCDSVSTLCGSRIYNSNLDVGFGYVFPQTDTGEFIGIWTAPVSFKWLGVTLGTGMLRSLLLVGWWNGNQPVISPRYAPGPDYVQPTLYTGPKITFLSTTGTNSTHQRIVFRCQNCTTWENGSIPFSSGFAVLGWALNAAIPVADPANIATTFEQHTTFGQHGLIFTEAQSANYNNYVTLLTPPTSSSSSTTRTSTSTSSSATVVPTGACAGVAAPRFKLNTAQGYTATTVLSGLTMPRGITTDTRGNLLVLQRGLGLTGHTVGADGCVTSTKTIISNTLLNHAVELSASGTFLFASTSDLLYRWNYDPATMTATNQQLLIKGMTNADHVTRTVINSRKYPNLLVVSRGSNSNLDQESFSANAARAIVKVFDINSVPSGGYDYTTQGRVLGYGLRNDVGLVEDRLGHIISVENSADNLMRTVNGVTTDVHNDNPAEKLLLLGDPSNPSGAFYGYPVCFSVWYPSNFIDKTFTPGDWFVQTPNATYNDAWCQNQATKHALMFPPHSAPLDVKLGSSTSDNNAYVTFHGSWNRNPPTGYKVVSVPGQYTSQGKWSPSASQSSTTGFTDLLWNNDAAGCNLGCFRPVGLVWANANYLYVSSDTTGEIFIVKRGGGGTSSTSTSRTSTSTSTRSSSSSTTRTSTTTTRTSTTSTRTSTSTRSSSTSSTRTSSSTRSTSTSNGLAARWGQCGGIGWSGPTQCQSPWTCTYQNDWYSQCL